MSKKASQKPDYSYHDDYYVDDGILEEDPVDTEYTDLCAQCRIQRLGYLDPSTHCFYCNTCWKAFNEPQSNKQQTKPQPQPQVQVQTAQEKPKTKKSRRSKKNKNKKQNQSTDTATPNKNIKSTHKTQEIQSKQPRRNTDNVSPKRSIHSSKRPSLFDTTPKPNKAQKKTDTAPSNQCIDITKRQSLFDTAPKQNKAKKNTENSSKSSILFGDNDTNNASSTLLHRPSLFGDDADPIDDDKEEIETNYNEYIDTIHTTEMNTDDIDIAPNPYIEEPKKQIISSHKKRRKVKSDGIIRRQFIGSRLESKQTYKRHKEQIEVLIKERFGLDDKEDNNEKKCKSKKNKRNEAKPHINLVVIGHVDAGKSTLMGRLLYEYGVVNSKTMHKYKRLSAEKGKSSFAYAWVLDCHAEERERGITVDVSTHYFETPHRCITLLDSPGHRDFIPSMISGASQADAAILVINSRTGDFETGFDALNGQTREHALIAKSLGVQQVIVAVNKMDCCGWSKDRFDSIVAQIFSFLRDIGFKKKNMVFIAVSGLTGRNLMANDEDDEKWWKQRVKDPLLTHLSLFEVIDVLRPSSSILSDSLHGVLRMSITDIYKELNVGIMATGKVLSGAIIRHQQILIQPLNLVTSVKNLISIDNHKNKYKHSIAIVGDNIQLLLDIKDSNDEIFDQIKVGDMITSPHQALPLIDTFQCKVVVMKNLKIPICRGHHVIIHTQSVEKEAYIVKIKHLINRKNGDIIQSKTKIRHIKADQCAMITVKLKNKNDVILLDTYHSLKALGRITLRRDGQTVALGLVETVGV